MDSQELVKRLYDSFGPKRLMWATDWPIAREKATYAQRLEVIRTGIPFLNAEDKRWLLYKTVREVWPFYLPTLIVVVNRNWLKAFSQVGCRT